MNTWRRRGLILALLFSIALHFGVLLAPGWSFGDWLTPEPERLDAHLAASKSAPPPAPKSLPVPETMPTPRPAPAVPANPPTPPADGVAPAGTPAPSSAPAPKLPVAAPLADEAPEAPVPLPSRGRIRFGVYKGEQGERSLLVGAAVHEWQHDGKRYRLTATTETIGIAALFKRVKIMQSSEGGFLKGELKPTQFRYDRGDGDVVESTFDWTTKSVTLQNGPVAAIGDGAEDMLSMFYQLMQAAQRGEGFVMAVANGRKVERYAFEWLAEETLDVKAGSLRCWHVRIRSAVGGAGDGKGVDVTDVWLGKTVAGLPVRIRYTDRKGEVGDQIAEQFEYEK